MDEPQERGRPPCYRLRQGSPPPSPGPCPFFGGPSGPGLPPDPTSADLLGGPGRRGRRPDALCLFGGHGSTKEKTAVGFFKGSRTNAAHRGWGREGFVPPPSAGFPLTMTAPRGDGRFNGFTTRRRRGRGEGGLKGFKAPGQLGGSQAPSTQVPRPLTTRAPSHSARPPRPALIVPVGVHSL